MRSLEEQEQREYHRRQVIQKAVQAADHIIWDGSDGSNEETNYLTAEVARKMMDSALHPFDAGMLAKDLELKGGEK